MSEWIPVEDRLPDKDMNCIITTDRGFVFSETFDADFKKFDSLKQDGKVIAWQPLPEKYTKSEPIKCNCSSSIEINVLPCGNGDLGARSTLNGGSIIIWIDRNTAAGFFEIKYCPFCGKEIKCGVKS